MNLLSPRQRQPLQEPETSPDPDPDSMADLPGFSPPRTMPGPAYPDPPGPQLPPGESAAGGGGNDKAGTGTSIPAFFKERAKSYAKISEGLLMALGGWL